MQQDCCLLRRDPYRDPSKGQRAAKIAELEQKLGDIKGELLAVMRFLTALGAALATTNKLAEKAKSNVPFYAPSEAHRKARGAVHKRSAPTK